MSTPEKQPGFTEENEPNREVMDGVIFDKIDKKSGGVEFRSSAPNRKIIIISESSIKPEPGVPYQVRVISDTKPADPLSGKMIVEIIIPEGEQQQPIIETEDAVSYLGVTLEKAKNSNSQFVPKKEQYTDFINDKDVALPLQRDIAVALLSGEPLLVDGGTSLGKTTTVKKMAADLGWEIHYANLNGATDVEDLMGRYIPNPNKNKPGDPEYIFADGKVTSGLRQEEGKVKVVILDEFNSSAPNILIRLHEILDSLERGGDVVLAEDASESVSVNKEKTKIIALMNPPGKGYFGREPLDPAQLRRWVYKKLPSELPEGTFSYATDALFGAESISHNVSPEMLLSAREEILSQEQLQEIPGIKEVLEKYKEFHRAAKELLKNRKIAEDQPQPFTFDDRMDPRRVRDFILRFYNGDINETFQKALRYYYSNKLETDVDKKKLDELIMHVEYRPKVTDSKRKGVERDVDDKSKKAKDSSKPRALPEAKLEEPIAEQIAIAIEKLGKENVLGPAEVYKTFNVLLATAEVPGIPFSALELEQAKELGQMLVLRVDKTGDGKPMSMEAMNTMLTKRWKLEKKGALLNTVDGWRDSITGVDDFAKITPRSGWALVSKDLLPDSTSKNYIEQTEVIVMNLKDAAFKDMELPEEYVKAIAEFESQKERLMKLMSEDLMEAARQLSELKINQLTRQSIQETIYDLAMYYDVHGKRLLPDKYVWSNSRSSAGGLVDLGHFGASGVSGNRWGPDGRNGDVGVSLSRRL